MARKVLPDQRGGLVDAGVVRDAHARELNAPLDAMLGHGFVEFAQQIVGGLDGAARNTAVIGKHQRVARQFGETELRVALAEIAEDSAIPRFA